MQPPVCFRSWERALFIVFELFKRFQGFCAVHYGWPATHQDCDTDCVNNFLLCGSGFESVMYVESNTAFAVHGNGNTKSDQLLGFDEIAESTEPCSCSAANASMVLGASCPYFPINLRTSSKYSGQLCGDAIFSPLFVCRRYVDVL